MPITYDSLQRKSERKMPRGIVYGPHGAGKNSLLSSLPSLVAIQTEDGFDAINEERRNNGLDEIPLFPIAKTFQDVMDAISVVYDNPEFSNLAFDSLDHFEPLVWVETCRRNGFKSIELDGQGKSMFGKGYVEAERVWEEFFEGLKALRDDLGMGVWITAHAEIKRFDDPEGDAFDTYRIKLHKRAAAKAQEWADQVWFLNYDVARSQVGEGFNKRTIGKGAGTRVLYTEKRPAFDAKRRGNVAERISVPKWPEPFNWQAVEGAFPSSYFN